MRFDERLIEVLAELLPSYVEYDGDGRDARRQAERIVRQLHELGWTIKWAKPAGDEPSVVITKDEALPDPSEGAA